MNEEYKQLERFISRLKGKKSELDDLLFKNLNEKCKKKIMELLVKVEGAISKAKTSLSSVHITGSGSNTITSGTQTSKLKDEILSLTQSERIISIEYNKLQEWLKKNMQEEQFSGHIEETYEEIMESKQEAPKPSVNTAKYNKETSEFTSHITDYQVLRSLPRNNVSPLEKATREGLIEVQDFIASLKKIKIELEILLSKNKHTKFRKKLMDLILHTQGMLTRLTVLQSSISLGTAKTLKQTGNVRCAQLEREIKNLENEKKDVLDKKRKIEAKLGQSQCETGEELISSDDSGVSQFFNKIGLIKTKPGPQRKTFPQNPKRLPSNKPNISKKVTPFLAKIGLLKKKGNKPKH